MGQGARHRSKWTEKVKLLDHAKEGKKHPKSKIWDGSKPEPVSHDHAPHRNSSSPFRWDYHAFLRAKAWRKKHSGIGSKYGINGLLSHVNFHRNARTLNSSTDDLLTGWSKHCSHEPCVSGVRANTPEQNVQNAGGHPNSTFYSLPGAAIGMTAATTRQRRKAAALRHSATSGSVSRTLCGVVRKCSLMSGSFRSLLCRH